MYEDENLMNNLEVIIENDGTFDCSAEFGCENMKRCVEEESRHRFFFDFRQKRVILPE